MFEPTIVASSQKESRGGNFSEISAETKWCLRDEFC